MTNCVSFGTKEILAMIKLFLKKTQKLCQNPVPKNRAGDNFVSFVRFIRSQRRLPNSENWQVDAWYAMKVSRELEHPLRVFTTDKEYAKLFVKSVVGQDHCVPTLKILHDKASVEAYSFPPRCCIKPTHSSGKYVLREDNEALPLDEIKGWFDHSWYEISRERNYKFLVPKVIVEPLVFDSARSSDYKFYCYRGSLKGIEVRSWEQGNIYYQDFDADWNFLFHAEKQDEYSPDILPRPGNLDAMIEASEAIAQYFSLVRVDFYTDGVNFFVGEITHCDGGAGSPPESRSTEDEVAKILFS